MALTPTARATPPATRGELRRRVQRLEAAASDQGRRFDADPAGTATARDQELDELEATARQLGSAAALSDLADVHAELGQLRRAADLYRDALHQGGPDVPVKAIEQVGNTLVRDAQQRLRHGAVFDDVRADVEQAQAWLSGALSLGETGERLALLGSYHLRCATMTAGDERGEHLRRAVEFYARAERAHDESYHWNNWVQLYHLLGGDADPSLAPWRPDARPIAPPVPAPAPAAASDTAPDPSLLGVVAPDAPPQAESFWDRAGKGDGLLTEGLVSGHLDAETMATTYLDAFRLRSSERERASVVDHLQNLAELLGADHPLRASLTDAVGRLDGWRP